MTLSVTVNVTVSVWQCDSSVNVTLSVTLTSAALAFWTFFCMFMSLRSDFLCKLLGWFQISMFFSGTLGTMWFSGVRRFWDFSLNFSQVNFVFHFPSTHCGKKSGIFGPCSSSLLSSSMELRISPVLLAVGFSFAPP